MQESEGKLRRDEKRRSGWRGEEDGRVGGREFTQHNADEIQSVESNSTNRGGELAPDFKEGD